MGFIAYDIAFLVIFTILVILFLSHKRKGLERQGIMYLYKTRIGIKAMDWTVKKFGGFLRPLQYVVILSGYLLMIVMSWLLLKSAYEYVTSPFLAELIRAPPVAPLIPYFPTLFNLESLFPPLYFTYFIIALIIVAVSHEFAHGIFARLYKVKIKTTGFAFLGPILGAFVEPDEKQMNRIAKRKQLAILAAGTFANMIMFAIFGVLMLAFFAVAFEQAGVKFNSYSAETIAIDSINAIEDQYDLDQIDQLNLSTNLVKVSTDQKDYFVSLNNLKNSLKDGIENIVAYEDSPAARAQIKGVIVGIDQNDVNNLQDLQTTLGRYSPGDAVVVKTLQEGEPFDYKVTLDERNGKAFLGVGFLQSQRGGIASFLTGFVEDIKDPFTYYEGKISSDFMWFVYYLLWWITVINVLVALFNMLPVSILDGGRFFYLTIWGITKNEKAGRVAFKLTTWAILAILVIMMARWFLIFF